MTLPVHDMTTPGGRAGFDKVLARLRTTAGGGEANAVVAEIIERVRANGDESVVGYMRKWTDPAFETSRIVVSKSELAAAERGLDAKLKAALAGAIANVRMYQAHIMPKAPRKVKIGGAELGLRFTPVDSVGLAVPGGRAAYPSTVIMLAVPALVAGVPPEAISVVTPPPTREARTSAGADATDVSPLVLAVCRMLGIERVYRIGGAQAIAALALGTRTVSPVDMIVGPGNVYVQLAKQQLAGVVGIDGFYGPSEIVTIADASADPRKVAADLIAQAEHDPGKCFLVAWSGKVIERIAEEVGNQMSIRKRRPAIERALREESAALLVRNAAEAVAIANTIAPEHLNLATKDPGELLAQIRHAGEVFLGDTTPVAAGDYWAGPSHCLPTGTTARFASGVSVYTFLKRSGTVHYPGPMPAEAIDAIARLAEAEGLEGHAVSARVRGG